MHPVWWIVAGLLAARLWPGREPSAPPPHGDDGRELRAPGRVRIVERVITRVPARQRRRARADTRANTADKTPAVNAADGPANNDNAATKGE